MLVLGIETTCDETSCAVVRDGVEILSNVIYSQIDIHSKFGGVVPELACRHHIDAISHVLTEALHKANVTLQEIDLIAVAKGPGLIGALLIGIHFAKALAWSLKKPIVGVNHVEAHLYAAIMSQPQPASLPALGVVLSGGHTSLVHMHGIGNYSLLGETVDDAIGEAFDKTAKILGLGYPGGPIIEKLAKKGNPKRFAFKAGQVKGRELDFSFSGIKTAVYYTIKDMQLSQDDICDVAASFQEAVFFDVLRKTELAIAVAGIEAIYLGGGVTQNSYLRELFQSKCPTACFWPKGDLCLDNAAMIAGLGYHMSHSESPFSIEPETRIPFHK
ncbi:MAG: tRNA (adenosine(37)-N6)-threonylcarbamoyltransferase complex transferase subunit TsaD [Verrucomicrobia bacterium]|nr:tRNA (adenosine(37)-N6)-threonylcarbamoyltransferase complex transferase subunit TsaD [Verrucomicrobiota bacterium]